MEKFWMSFLLAGFLIGIINLMIEASFILKKLNYEIMDIKTKFLTKHNNCCKCCNYCRECPNNNF